MAPLGRFIACFGNGQHGRLGHRTGEASELFPRVVAALADRRASRVACGGAHTAAIMGEGAEGLKGRRCGDARGIDWLAAGALAVLRHPLFGPSSPTHPHARASSPTTATEDGSLWSWGMNNQGQLGHSSEMKTCGVSQPSQTRRPQLLTGF
jgi:alpha-tubulin suppressor-like RCC1 family protein